MKALLLVIFGLFLSVTMPVFADGLESKVLVKNEQYIVERVQDSRGTPAKEVKALIVSIQSVPEKSEFGVARINMTVRKSSPFDPNAGKDQPKVTYWVHYEVLVVSYLIVGNDEPDFCVLVGDNLPDAINEFVGISLNEVKFINEKLAFVKITRLRYEEPEKFEQAIQPAIDFAKKVIQEAESFKEETGFTESITKEIPGFLNLNLSEFGLSEPKQEEKE